MYLHSGQTNAIYSSTALRQYRTSALPLKQPWHCASEACSQHGFLHAKYGPNNTLRRVLHPAGRYMLRYAKPQALYLYGPSARQSAPSFGFEQIPESIDALDPCCILHAATTPSNSSRSSLTANKRVSSIRGRPTVLPIIILAVRPCKGWQVASDSRGLSAAHALLKYVA